MGLTGELVLLGCWLLGCWLGSWWLLTNGCWAGFLSCWAGCWALTVRSACCFGPRFGACGADRGAGAVGLLAVGLLVGFLVAAD